MNTKQQEYHSLYNQIEAITSTESDLVANLSNTAAVLFNYLENVNWAGFYLLKDNVLVLGPFQGQPACIRIDIGKGVCGTAVASNQTQLVTDVHAFEGHIACDAASQSEVVVPLRQNGKVIGVLDIDSPMTGRFDEDDKSGLEKISVLVERFFR